MAEDRKQARHRKEPYFLLQWHLTVRCQQKCAHCYIPEAETFQRELENELSYEDCVKIIDDLSETFGRWKMPTRINFTGGDPLLKPEIYDLIAYARARNIRVGILGNPNLLTQRVARRLKQLGLHHYQVSIDGLEETHDRLRGRTGLFRDTIRAIRVLKEAEIKPVVMFTLSRQNAHELIEVIRLVASEGVHGFDFARLVPIGSGGGLQKDMLTPLEYRTVLLSVHEEYERLADSGCQTVFGRKEHLWNLLYQEMGLLEPLPQDKLVRLGCPVGCSRLTMVAGYGTLSILADGTVLPCRRLPLAVGKVPEQTIQEIFMESEALNELRNIELMEKCGRCELLRRCRGCPSVAYAVHGSYFAPDPQCWKEL